MNEAIKAQGLVKRYPGFALDRVGFSLASGSIMGLIGDNGAGKTTTLKLLLQLIRPDEGEVLFFGKAMKEEEMAIKQQIGVVFDECHFSEYLFAADLDPVFRAIYPTWDSDDYQRLLRDFGLPAKEKIKGFSRGMKMKLSMACALAHHPRLLILDEPTGGLDPVFRSELLDRLLAFIQDESHSVLLSSHITSDLERICDSIAFLHEGRLVLCEDKDDLMERLGVLRCDEAALAGLDLGSGCRIRKNSFGCEILLADRPAFVKKYPAYPVDPASLEDLMVFYAKGETV